MRVGSVFAWTAHLEHVPKCQACVWKALAMGGQTDWYRLSVHANARTAIFHSIFFSLRNKPHVGPGSRLYVGSGGIFGTASGHHGQQAAPRDEASQNRN
jgi:hypothetical protein